MITVPGRVLNPPKVKYARDIVPRNGRWNMAGHKFASGTQLRGTWTYLTLRDKNMRYQRPELDATVHAFGQALNVYGVKTGARLTDPEAPELTVGDNEEANDAKLNDMFNRLASHPTARLQFLLVILPRADAGLYNRVKTLGDVTHGIHTVCVVAQKFMKEKGQDMYFANVATKFNLKLGGTNQLLEPSRFGIIGEGKTMVVGIDVTHPSPGSLSKAPSVAAMVASINKSIAQWPADIRIQASRQEMVTDLKDMMLSRLKLWQANNKSLPDNILIYRDGVSEGQYQSVLNEELPLLRAAYREKYTPEQTNAGYPRTSIIIVGKRHHTRFYPTKLIDADRTGNTTNGTVVDRGITEAVNWDFFLQAHTCLQGTARPAHYYIILDEIFKHVEPKLINKHKNRADILEDLTHSMCYTFGRATVAVSICPPAYYADLVCERARCYLSSIFDPSTPAATDAGSVAGGAGGAIATDNDVRIHHRLRDTMFYM